MEYIFLYAAYILNFAILGTGIVAIRKFEKKKHYKLQKYKQVLNEKTKNIISIDKPVYMLLSNEEKKVLLDVTKELETKNKKAYNFYETLKENISPENLRNFINNIQIAKIRIHRRLPFSSPIVYGMFDNKKKTVTIKKNKPNVFSHELLHLSSSKLYYSSVGFHFYEKDDFQIGRGLNEGYTEIQNNRIFYRSFGYIKLQKLATLIEMFYENKEDMQNQYFNGDINGIYHELSNYMTFEEINNLLIDID